MGGSCKRGAGGEEAAHGLQAAGPACTTPAWAAALRDCAGRGLGAGVDALLLLPRSSAHPAPPPSPIPPPKFARSPPRCCALPSRPDAPPNPFTPSLPRLWAWPYLCQGWGAGQQPQVEDQQQVGVVAKVEEVIVGTTHVGGAVGSWWLVGGQQRGSCQALVTPVSLGDCPHGVGGRGAGGGGDRAQRNSVALIWPSVRRSTTHHNTRRCFGPAQGKACGQDRTRQARPDHHHHHRLMTLM